MTTDDILRDILLRDIARGREAIRWARERDRMRIEATTTDESATCPALDPERLAATITSAMRWHDARATIALRSGWTLAYHEHLASIAALATVLAALDAKATS